MIRFECLESRVYLSANDAGVSAETVFVASEPVIVVEAEGGIGGGSADGGSGADLMVPEFDLGIFIGGNADIDYDMAVDTEGNVYMAGGVRSDNWLVDGESGASYGKRDVYVVKFDSAGNHVWTRFLGGSKDDVAATISIDSSGNVLVGGVTESEGWVRGGWDTTFGGETDRFVAKLSAGGELLWATYLGFFDYSSVSISDIACDTIGNVIVVGTTNTAGWVAGGWNILHGGKKDGFVVKLSSEGHHLWSAFHGGENDDWTSGVATDSVGDIYISGSTESENWTRIAEDQEIQGSSDAYLMKLSSTGEYLWYKTFGGEDSDGGGKIVIDETGQIIVQGSTRSPDWISGGWDTTYSGNYSDGFVAKLSVEGDFVWSSYIGGIYTDRINDLAVDTAGNIYAVGQASSSGWVSGGFDVQYDGVRDGYVVKLRPDGSHAWSSYLGGTRNDNVRGIAVLGGRIYFGGSSSTPEDWIGWIDPEVQTSGTMVWVFEGNEAIVSVESMEKRLASGLVDIVYDGSEEIAPGVIRLYYDDGGFAYEGTLVGEMNPEGGEIVWDMSELRGGEYYLYATLESASGEVLQREYVRNYFVTRQFGDFDLSGGIDVDDIRLLQEAIRNSGREPYFDLDGDGFVTDGDLEYFIFEVLNTRPGDSNLDGIVNLSDLAVLADHFGSSDSHWGEGDFNGDGVVNLIDLATLANEFGSRQVIGGGSGALDERDGVGEALLSGLALGDGVEENEYGWGHIGDVLDEEEGELLRVI